MKKQLYIPVNVVEEEDFISGFGNKELAIAGITLIMGVIFAVIIWFQFENMIAAIAVPAFLLSIVITMIKRDRFNESLVDKFRFVKIYLKAQKKYEYRYFNIYEGEIDG